MIAYQFLHTTLIYTSKHRQNTRQVKTLRSFDGKQYMSNFTNKEIRKTRSGGSRENIDFLLSAPLSFWLNYQIRKLRWDDYYTEIKDLLMAPWQNFSNFRFGSSIKQLLLAWWNIIRTIFYIAVVAASLQNTNFQTN